MATGDPFDQPAHADDELKRHAVHVELVVGKPERDSLVGRHGSSSRTAYPATISH